VKDAASAVRVIQQQIGRSEDARYDHRLHGVLLVAKGYDCYEVAEILGHSPTTIENWVNTYNTRGVEGLHDDSRPGRPSRISDAVKDQIDHDLRKNPRDLGYSQNLWDGKLLSHHLKERYQITLGIRQAQRLFHQLGFRQRKPRPVISRGDPVAQEAFKKNSRNWRRMILSRSGAWMSATFSSMGRGALCGYLQRRGIQWYYRNPRDSISVFSGQCCVE